MSDYITRERNLTLLTDYYEYTCIYTIVQWRITRKSTKSKGETSHTSLPCFCCLQDRSSRVGDTINE